MTLPALPTKPPPPAAGKPAPGAGGTAGRRRKARRWRPQPIRRVPFALVLSTVVGLPIALAVLMVIGISSYGGFTAALSLVAQRTDLLLTAAEDRVRAHLDPAAAAVAALVDRIERNQSLRQSEERLTDLFAGALAGLGGRAELIALLRPDASVLAVRLVEGRAAAVRLATGDIEMAVLRNDFALGKIDAPFWDEVRVLPLSGVTLNVHMAIRDEDGDFAGVIAATVPVRALSEFMLDMEAELDGDRAYLLATDGTVVAHALLAEDPAEPIADTDADGDAEPVTVEDLGDPVLARLDERRALDIPFFDAVEMSVIALGELEFMVLERELVDYGPTPLTLGVYFEREGPPQELLRVAVSAVLGAGILALAVFVSLSLARSAARPIRLLAENAHAIGALEFTRVQPLPPSRVSEFDEQARAFNAMTTSLRWFETYVPKRLVHRLADSGADAALASRERELTILFTDIAGFTALSEEMPAPAIAALLNDHFRLVAQAVDAQDGTIDKFIGDGLMAFWGAPVGDPDHALKACRAVAAIALAVEADNAQRRAAGQVAIRVRGGLHTGRVVVGNIGAPGRMNYTVVGDPVNVASRLEQAGRDHPATAGDADATLLISATTIEAARAALDRLGVTAPLPVAPLGPQILEGRQASLEGFRLVPAEAATWLAVLDTLDAVEEAVETHV